MGWGQATARRVLPGLVHLFRSSALNHYAVRGTPQDGHGAPAASIHLGAWQGGESSDASPSSASSAARPRSPP